MSLPRQISLNGVDVLLYRYLDVNTRQINRIVGKQTNFNLETFNVFNIIETLKNYFTRELLWRSLSSEVALHFNVN